MGKRRVIKVIIADDSRLEKIAERGFSPWAWVAILAASTLALFLVAGTLIMVTPLRTLLPGYLKESQRNNTMDNIMRLDSLRTVFEQNQAYLNNLENIFDTERTRSDSTSLVVNANPLTTDSLLDTSSAEKKFVKMMEERERYNISILAPLAAEGLLFGEVSPGSAVTEKTRRQEKASLVIPSGGLICTVTEGRVVDVHYDINSGGYSVIIQHPKGFASRYSHLPKPLVNEGQHVETGAALAVAPSAGTVASNTIGVEMWRNGDALIPAQYIGFTTFAKTPEDEQPVTEE